MLREFVRCGCGERVVPAFDPIDEVCEECGRPLELVGNSLVDEEDGPPVVPDGDDLVTRDYQVWVNNQTGRVEARTDPDSWREDLAALFDKQGYWPNIWFYLERDVYYLLSLEEGD